MQIDQLKAPSGLHALLWKDFQQVKPALAAIAIGIVALQLVLLAAYSLTPATSQQNAVEFTLVLALITPALGALACCGMLIGHERQSGTWAWSSGLPLSWQSALSSKLFVSLFSSLFLMLPTLVIPLTALWLGSRLPQQSVIESVYASPIVALVVLEIIVLLSLTTLLFRETLTGMVWGAVGILCAQMLFLAISSRLINKVNFLNTFIPRTDRGELVLICAQMLILLVVGSVMTALVFRWRWGIGQLAEWKPRRLRVVTTPSRPAQIRQGQPPRLFWALFLQSWRMSLGTRLAVLSVLVLAAAYWLINPTSDPGGYFLLLVFAICILGTTAFEGDQTAQRYRFMADRGVPARKLVTARLLTAGGLILFVACAALMLVAWHDTPDWHTLGLLSAFCLSAFLVSAMCSLCFNKSIIAVTVALVSLVAVAILAVSIAELDFNQSDVNPRWLQQYVLALSPLSILVMLIAIYRLAARWLTTDRPRLEKHFAWILPSAVLLPVALPVLFGFLALPNVPWQGAPRSSVQTTSPTAPRITMDTLVRSTPSNVYSFEHMVTLGAREGYYRHFYDNGYDAEELDARVQELLSELQQPQQQRTDLRQLTSQLNGLIAETAALASLHREMGDTKMSKKLWRCNKLLQDIDLGSAWMLTIESRTLVLAIWQQWSLRELRELGTIDELRSEYLPDFSNHQAQASRWLREQATLERELLRGRQIAGASYSRSVNPSPWIAQVVPTLRWRHERSLALSLAESLENIQNPHYYDPNRVQRYEEVLYSQFRNQLDGLKYKLQSLKNE